MDGPHPICSHCQQPLKFFGPLCEACAESLLAAGALDQEAMPAWRDPRTNPRPGDALRAGTDERHVIGVDAVSGSVEYGFPGKAATRWLTLFDWQRWARNAEVIEVAP